MDGPADQFSKAVTRDNQSCNITFYILVYFNSAYYLFLSLSLNFLILTNQKVKVYVSSSKSQIAEEFA